VFSQPSSPIHTFDSLVARHEPKGSPEILSALAGLPLSENSPEKKYHDDQQAWMGHSISSWPCPAMGHTFSFSAISEGVQRNLHFACAPGLLSTASMFM
jgi:hypothetical protein